MRVLERFNRRVLGPTALLKRCAGSMHGLLRRPLLSRFAADESGNYLVTTGLLMPVLLGAAGMGTEVGLWSQKQQNMRSAADSSAISAALAYSNGDIAGVAPQAQAVAVNYGLVHGQDGVTIAINQPPAAGAYAGVDGAVEVVITREQKRLFSALWSSEPLTLSARATALTKSNATGCVLALDPGASGAATATGSTKVTLNGCSLYANSAHATALVVGGSARLDVDSVGVVGGISGVENITTSQGIMTGRGPVSDPYSKMAFPSFSGCHESNFTAKEAVTISPGVYCGGMRLNAGADVYLTPGIYYLDQGELRVTGGATLRGNSVTLVFTSSTGNNWATASIGGNATINLTAPSSGPTAGIVMFGDRKITPGTSFGFQGGMSQVLGGAVYIPTGAISFSGGANTSVGCTHVVGKTITFTGNSNLTINCSNYATKPFGSVLANLVE